MASELHTALREIHTAGWYHGDLSPRNVMWRLLTGSSGGVVRTLADVELVVIDFGFSRKLTGSALEMLEHRPYVAFWDKVLPHRVTVSKSHCAERRFLPGAAVGDLFSHYEQRRRQCFGCPLEQRN